MQELLIYGPINEESSRRFIDSMNEMDSEAVDLRINSEGGSPEYGWGMIAKIAENKDKINSIKVDGQAMSMACFALCYLDNTEALDVSSFLIHRAAYAEWFENSDMMTEDLWDNLNSINASLMTALKNKIDYKALEEMKGVKIKDIFSNDARIGVTLTAKEAKKVGLINKVVKLTPSKKAEIEARAEATSVPVYAKVAQYNPDNDKNSNKMNLTELKSQHPELVEQIEKDALKNERERVDAFLQFIDTDKEACLKAIENGDEFNARYMAKFAKASQTVDQKPEDKKAAKEAKEELEKEAEKTVATQSEPENPKSEKEAFFAEARKRIFNKENK